MLWIFYALAAHAGNGVVFLFDKGLLATDSKAGDPVRLAFYSGLVSAAAAVLLFLDFQAPTASILGWAIFSGVSFVLALVCFFWALDTGEASRVVPITGSAVPFFTFVFAVTTLGEVLAAKDIASVALLIIGGAILSWKTAKRRMSSRTLGVAILAGVFFAAYFAVVKHMYDSFPSFWSAFAYSRMSVGVAALVILGPFLQSKKKKAVQGKKQPKKPGIAVAFFASKILGTSSFILQNYAISLGSVTIVNALQGTQYLIVLVAAALLSRWFPKLFSEELTQLAVTQKVVGIICVSAGLLLLA